MSTNSWCRALNDSHSQHLSLCGFETGSFYSAESHNISHRQLTLSKVSCQVNITESRTDILVPYLHSLKDIKLNRLGWSFTKSKDTASITQMGPV